MLPLMASAEESANDGAPRKGAPAATRLTPRHHSRTSAVVTGRSEGSCDTRLLVSPPRAQASLSPGPPPTSRAAISNDATRLGSHKKDGLLTTQDNACFVHKRLVVVVVRTLCICDVSVHATQQMHLIRVAERLGASSWRGRHPFTALMAGVNLAVYLCTRLQKDAS